MTSCGMKKLSAYDGWGGAYDGTSGGWISGQYQGYRPYGEAGDGIGDRFRDQWNSLSPEVQQQWREWARNEVYPRAQALASKFRSLPVDEQEAWKDWVRSKFASRMGYDGVGDLAQQYRSLPVSEQQQWKDWARSRLATSPRVRQYRSLPPAQQQQWKDWARSRLATSPRARSMGYVPGDGCGCGGPAGFGGAPALASRDGSVGNWLGSVGSDVGSSISSVASGIGSATQSVTGYRL